MLDGAASHMAAIDKKRLSAPGGLADTRLAHKAPYTQPRRLVEKRHHLAGNVAAIDSGEGLTRIGRARVGDQLMPIVGEPEPDLVVGED